MTIVYENNNDKMAIRFAQICRQCQRAIDTARPSAEATTREETTLHTIADFIVGQQREIKRLRGIGIPPELRHGVRVAIPGKKTTVIAAFITEGRAKQYGDWVGTDTKNSTVTVVGLDVQATDERADELPELLELVLEFSNAFDNGNRVAEAGGDRRVALDREYRASAELLKWSKAFYARQATDDEDALLARRQEHECKVCGNIPDEFGELEHGKGCYVVSSDGGGSTSHDVSAKTSDADECARIDREEEAIEPEPDDEHSDDEKDEANANNAAHLRGEL